MDSTCLTQSPTRTADFTGCLSERVSGMSWERALFLMSVEEQCILRNETHSCDRNCASCDLLQTTADLLTAYDLAKRAIQSMIDLRNWKV